MLSAEMFEGLEVQIRDIMGNDKPMGGLQLILCGEWPCMHVVDLPMCVRTLCSELTLSEHACSGTYVCAILCTCVWHSTLLCR